VGAHPTCFLYNSANAGKVSSAISRKISFASGAIYFVFTPPRDDNPSTFKTVELRTSFLDFDVTRTETKANYCRLNYNNFIDKNNTKR
jgi:hypothetical protein